jgi:hypothetical protein
MPRARWKRPAGPRRNQNGRQGVIAPITPELPTMSRFLPQSLIFVALHVVLIGVAVTVATFN